MPFLRLEHDLGGAVLHYETFGMRLVILFAAQGLFPEAEFRS